MSAWPTAELDPVARLRVLAAGLPHVVLGERVIEAPLDQVWGVAGDLERGVPRFESNVSSVEILRSQGEERELVAVGLFGIRFRFDAILRPGWCVMQSRVADIGMAAAPEGDGTRTRFAHFEGSRLLGALAHTFVRRSVARDLAELARICEVEGQGQGVA